MIGLLALSIALLGIHRFAVAALGALYTYGWIRDLDHPDEVVACPMHEEPLHLVRDGLRPMVEEQINSNCESAGYRVRIE